MHKTMRNIILSTLAGAMLFLQPVTTQAKSVSDEPDIPASVKDVEAYDTRSSGMTMSAAVFQGDTNNASDVEVFYTHLLQKGYDIDYYGFHGTDGSPKATGDNLSSGVSGKMLIYWSSHGDDSPKLNAQYGPSFNTLTYFNPSNSSSLRIAILAACHQLDGDANRSAFAAKMRQSRLRIIAGYHENAPGGESNTLDETAAEEFFDQVEGGNSIRYSWEVANGGLVYKSGAWIVLAYQNGEMEYYRMPGYPNERNTEYTLPTGNTPIYRYWGIGASSQMRNSSAATKNTLSAKVDIPLVLKPVDGEPKVAEAAARSINSDVLISRNSMGSTYKFHEPSTSSMSDVNMTEAASFAKTDLQLGDLLTTAKVDEYYVMSAEIRNDGTDGPESVIGHRYTYTNTYNSIPVEGNLISVAFDNQGVYNVIDQWSDLAPVRDEVVRGDALMQKATDLNLADALADGRLAYVDNGNGEYVLSVVTKEDDIASAYSLVDGLKVQ